MCLETKQAKGCAAGSESDRQERFHDRKCNEPKLHCPFPVGVTAVIHTACSLDVRHVFTVKHCSDSVQGHRHATELIKLLSLHSHLYSTTTLTRNRSDHLAVNSMPVVRLERDHHMRENKMSDTRASGRCGGAWSPSSVVCRRHAPNRVLRSATFCSSDV